MQHLFFITFYITDVLEHILPPAINNMNESAIQTFREALEEGHEHFHHVRVMVVGYHGAGKSSLTKRLLRENVEHVKSTEGVEIFTKRGRFQLSDHKWIKYDGKQGHLLTQLMTFCMVNCYKILKTLLLL